MKKRSPQFFYFDLGRVLLEFDHEVAVQQLAKLGDVSVDRVREVVFEASLQSDYERGQISTAEFCRQFREGTGLHAHDEAICQAASDIFSINRPVVQIVQALYESGWPLGLLSNTCDAHWNWILSSDYKFLDLLSPTILSFEVKAAKPDAKIFEDAANLAKHPPDAIFFVDDLAANVDGARDAGFDAVIYTSAEQLAADLRSRGIELDQ